jgi:hypothetical protein
MLFREWRRDGNLVTVHVRQLDSAFREGLGYWDNRCPRTKICTYSPLHKHKKILYDWSFYHRNSSHAASQVWSNTSTQHIPQYIAVSRRVHAARTVYRATLRKFHSVQNKHQPLAYEVTGCRWGGGGRQRTPPPRQHDDFSDGEEAPGLQQTLNWPDSGSMLHTSHLWKNCTGRHGLVYDKTSCKRKQL